MNWLDKSILSVAPAWGAQRIKNKIIAEKMLGYDAAKPGRTRKMKVDNRNGDSAIYGSAESIRGQARYLDENHDIVVGLLDKLEQKVVGPKGIAVEPMPFTVAGEKHEEFAQELSRFFEKLSMAPDTTGTLTRGQVEQMVCRTWLRDGECFGKYIEGNVANFKHNTAVPFSVELLEPDFLPFRSDKTNIVQGIERNAWGQPLAFHFLKSHPGGNVGYSSKTFRVPADRVQHIKLSKRIGQGRGMSILHAVITRLEDLKDYEESERVAARISAVLAAYIKKAPDSYGGKSSSGDRLFELTPGMVFDDLMPGEEVGTVQSNRPSALLQPFRDSMLRAVSAGTRGTFSTISGQFDGNYSSQRQEMVEGYAGYEFLQNTFIAQWSRPFYRRAIRMGIASGMINVPLDIDPDTIYNAVYLTPVMPWIDPNKESQAHERNIQMGIETEAAVIRSRSKNPAEVKKQRIQEIKENKENDLIFSSDVRHELQPVTTNTQGAPDAE